MVATLTAAATNAAAIPAGPVYQLTLTAVAFVAGLLGQVEPRGGTLNAWQLLSFTAVVAGTVATAQALGTGRAPALVAIVVASLTAIVFLAMSATGGAASGDVKLAPLVAAAAATIDTITAGLWVGSTVLIMGGATVLSTVRRDNPETPRPLAAFMAAGIPIAVAVTFWFRPELVALLA
ncbi:hypothetical protein [Agromyces humi]|uniref:hypothetical protein n=1 Tax=Agromyces humi TaxID=1766800 RepID=UPI001358D338|nr:hypothetical protein [Agromyces humi]